MEAVAPLTDAEADICWDLSAPLAASVARTYAGFVEAGDLRTQMTLWAIEHPEKVREWLSEEREGALGLTMKREAVRYARRQKAAISGYSVDDEFMYSPAVVGELLPFAVSGDYLVQRSKPEGGGRSHKPANERGDFETLCLEIALHYRQLDLRDQDALFTHYVMDMSVRDVQDDPTSGARSKSSVHRDVQQALKRLCRRLNGETKPVRRVVSNSSAQAVTSRLT